MTAKIIRMPRSERYAKPEEKQPEHDKIKLDKKVDKVILQHKKLMRRIRKNRKNPQRIDLLSLRYLRDSCLEMSVSAKKSYFKSEGTKGIYAYDRLVNQFRELSHEIRALEAGKGNSEHIIDQILVPGIRVIMQHLLNDFNEIKQNINKSLPPKKAQSMVSHFNKLLSGYASLIENVTKDVSEQTEKYLNG